MPVVLDKPLIHYLTQSVVIVGRHNSQGSGIHTVIAFQLVGNK